MDRLGVRQLDALDKLKASYQEAGSGGSPNYQKSVSLLNGRDSNVDRRDSVEVQLVAHDGLR